MEKLTRVLSLLMLVIFFISTKQFVFAASFDELKAKMNHAIEYNMINDVKMLLEEHPSLLNTVIDESNNNTPLLLAVYCGHKRMTDILVAKGAGVFDTDKYGNSVLHLAVIGYGRKGLCTMSYVAIITSILPRIDVNAKNNWGETPIDLAIAQGKQELVDLLNGHFAYKGRSNRRPLIEETGKTNETKVPSEIEEITESTRAKRGLVVARGGSWYFPHYNTFPRTIDNEQIRAVYQGISAYEEYFRNPQKPYSMPNGNLSFGYSSPPGYDHNEDYYESIPYPSLVSPELTYKRIGPSSNLQAIIGDKSLLQNENR